MPPQKRGVVSHLKIPFTQGCLFLKLAQLFWRKRFLISTKYFCYFAIISLWKNCVTLIFDELESLLYKNFLCQVWLKLTLLIWKLRFKCRHCIFAIVYPLKQRGPSLPINQGCFVQSLVESGPSLWKKLKYLLFKTPFR